MKKILIILVLSMFIFGCNSTLNREDDMQKIMNENEHIIIDVRTKEEYEELHIVGAINIPYDEINENTNLDKNKIIFVYCKSGGRSKTAYDNLTNLGYTVYDLGAFAEIDMPKE